MAVSDKNTPPKEIELRERLQSHLRDIQSWLNGKQDRAEPLTGDDFNGLAARTGCAEDIDMTTSFNANFNGFIYPPNPGQHSFTNAITYGAAGLENTERLFAARCHEYIHALQYDVAAALHADPYNAATTIILCPEDYVLRKERLEQDAYVKGAWLCAMALGDHPAVTAAMSHIPLPLSVFLDRRAQTSSLQEAFHAAARDCRNATGTWTNGQLHKTAIADSWHQRAIDEYKNLIASRLKKGEKLTFVRMEEKDLREITGTLGRQSIAHDGHSLDFETITPEHRADIDALNKLCGINARAALPSLEQALTAAGLSRAAFLQKSKSYKGPVL